MPAAIPTPDRRRPMTGTGRLRDTRGLTNSVQWAVLFPLIMLCTLGIIQAGVWIHGHHVAVAATDTAVDLARGSTGEADDTAVAAARRVASSGGLTDVQLSVVRSDTEVTVELTGRVPLFVDIGGLGSIRQIGHAPVEQVTTP